jgi:N-acetylglutamate synthase-like GNAT family acetyltransferase
MAGQIALRLAKREDIPALSALIIDSARELSRGFYSAAETESAIRYVFGVDTALVDDQTYFVAELDGTLAGCGGWSRRNTLYGGDQRPVGEASVLDPTRDAARIRALFVAPSATRRGVGRMLLDECARAARSAGFHSLTLMATLPGVPFYRALGFIAAEDVVDTLPDGTPLRFVRMSRRIDDTE